MKFHYNDRYAFFNIEKPDFSKDEKIVLWGAGKIGEVIAYALDQKNIKFDFFVDSASDKWNMDFCGHRVVSPEEFFENYSNETVIVSNGFPTTIDIVKKQGIAKIYDPHSLLMDIDFSKYEGSYTVEFLKRCIIQALRNYKLYFGIVGFLEPVNFLITDFCSLRCENCDSYIPYFKNPQMDSLEVIIESFNRLISACGIINEIDVFGGEPLVHPDINRIVSFFANHPKCKRLKVITNGTIVPTPDLLKIMKNPKCSFRISDYGELSRKLSEIKAILNDENIKYEVTNYTGWDRLPLIEYRNESDAELNQKFATCTTNALYVKSGYITYCNFLAGIRALDETAIPNMSDSYVNLFESENTEDNIRHIKEYIERLQKRQFVNACRYCPGNHCLQFENKVPVAEQTKETFPLDKLYKGGKRIWN